MKGKLFIAAFLLVSLFSLPAFAGWDEKPEFRWMQLYRFDERRSDHALYTNRLSLTFAYQDVEKKELFKLTPFFEIRRNVNKGLWERKELGLEIGRDITPWLYVGQAVHQGWMNEDHLNYGDYVKRGYTESETRLYFSRVLTPNSRIKVRGYVLEEFSYDFRDGRASRNEVAVGAVIPIGKNVETDLRWRHIDRITNYDSDTYETSVTLVF